MARGISIHIGLNNVNPAAYGGWDGKLAGCINDAFDMEALATSVGFQTSRIVDAGATSAAVIAAIGRAARELAAGDILLVSYSGHGGQVHDIDVDEDDGWDETWVLWDRQLVDDELGALWAQFEPGVRIVVLSDSCHSGTVLRRLVLPRVDGPGAGPRAVPTARDVQVAFDLLVAGYRGYRQVLDTARGEPSAVAEAPPALRSMPPEVSYADATARRELYDTVQWAAGSARSQEIRASVLLLSGCQDNQLSSDGARNGLFTETLEDVWGNGSFAGGYSAFWRAIQARMPSYQSPNLDRAGTPWPDFEAQKPFTIAAPGATTLPVPPPLTQPETPPETPPVPQPVTPPTTPVAVGGGHPQLALGSSGPEVEVLQRLLVDHGHNLTVDGSFGPLTRSAVRAFQQARGLVVDGIVGALTWAALERRGPTPAATPAPGEGKADGPAARGTPSGARGLCTSAAEVTAVQEALGRLGYNVPKDGRYTAHMRSHVRAFQRTASVPVTGSLDRATYDAILAAAGPA